MSITEENLNKLLRTSNDSSDIKHADLSSADLDKLFDPENPKHAELVEIIKKMAQQDPDTMKKYAKDVFSGKGGEDLVKTVEQTQPLINNVKHAFVTIEATLSVVDAKKLVISGKALRTFATASEAIRKDAQGNDVKVILPGWKDIAKTFEDIMKDSQKVAAKAAHTAKEFSDVLVQVLLDSDTSKADAHDILDVYKKDVHAEQEEAANVGSKLTQLHKDIKNFQAELSDALNKDSAIKKDIEDVRAAIGVLDERIEKLDKLINGCMWSAIGGGIGCLAGMLLCLTPLAPLGCGLIMLSVASAGTAGVLAESWGRQVSVARKDRQEKQHQLDQLITTQQDLAEVHGKLAQIDSQWTTIAKGLEAISLVWGAFSESLIEVESSLTKTDAHMKHEGKHWQKVYLLDLLLLEAVYARVSQMLHQWAVNVTAVYDGPTNEPAPPYKP